MRFGQQSRSMMLMLVLLTLTALTPEVGFANSYRQDAVILDAEENAAVWYERAAAEVRAMDAEDWGAIVQYVRGGTIMPDPHVASLLRGLRSAHEDAIRGSVQKRGVPTYFRTVLFAGRMRCYSTNTVHRVDVLLRAGAKFDASRGRPVEASKSIVALMRMSNHLAADPVLHAPGVIYRTNETLDLLLESGSLDAEAARVIESEIEISRGDLCAASGHAIRELYERKAEWLVSRAEAGDLDAIRSSHAKFSETPFPADVSGLDIVATCEEVRALAVELETLIADAESDEDVKRVQELMKAEHVGLSAVLFPDLAARASGAASGVVKQREYYRTLLARLKRIKEDGADVPAVENAAFLYLQAIQHWEAIPERMRGSLLNKHGLDEVQDERAIRAPARPVLDRVAQEDLDRALEGFRQASKIRRCDFAIARKGPDAPSMMLIASYLPGMHEIIRLLHGRARAALLEENQEIAAAELAAAIRATSHLASDPTALSPVIAHEAMVRANSLLERFAKTSSWTPAQTALLRSSLDRFEKSDTFGFEAARRETARIVAWELGWRPKEPEDLAFEDRWEMTREVRDWRYEEVIRALVVVNALGPVEVRRPGFAPRLEWSGVKRATMARNRMQKARRMGSAIDSEALLRIEAWGRGLRSHLDRGEFNAIREATLPSISRQAEPWSSGVSLLASADRWIEIMEDGVTEEPDGKPGDELR